VGFATQPAQFRAATCGASVCRIEHGMRVAVTARAEARDQSAQVSVVGTSVRAPRRSWLLPNEALQGARWCRGLVRRWAAGAPVMIFSGCTGCLQGRRTRRGKRVEISEPDENGGDDRRQAIYKRIVAVRDALRARPELWASKI